MKMAEQFYRSQQKEGLLAWVRIEIATILLNQGKVTKAVSKLRQADAILQGRETSDSVTLGHWQLVMGMAEAAQGNPTKALYYLAHAEPIFVKEKNQRFLARVYEVRARILEQQGQISAALSNLKLFVETKHSLERVLREQRSLQMRFEFDLARKELENQALKTKQLLQEAKLKQLQERRHWQYVVVALLLLVMGMLALHQFNRSRQMRRLAMTDDLTGLHNRRQIQNKGQNWFRQAREQGKPFSVLLLDIDHFKLVNDQLGLRGGSGAGRRGQVHRRPAAFAGQSGAQRRRRVSGAAARHLSGRGDGGGGADPSSRLPAAYRGDAGGAFCQRQHRLCPAGSSRREPGGLVQRADEAMYRAKQAGRNQVMRAE